MTILGFALFLLCIVAVAYWLITKFAPAAAQAWALAFVGLLLLLALLSQFFPGATEYRVWR